MKKYQPLCDPPGKVSISRYNWNSCSERIMASNIVILCNCWYLFITFSLGFAVALLVIHDFPLSVNHKGHPLWAIISVIVVISPFSSYKNSSIHHIMEFNLLNLQLLSGFQTMGEIYTHTNLRCWFGIIREWN